MNWLYGVLLLIQHTAARSPWDFLKDILLISCVGCYTVSFSGALGLTEVWVMRSIFSSLHSLVDFASAFYQIHDLTEGKEQFEEMIMRVFWEFKRSWIVVFFLKAYFNSWQICGRRELEYLQKCEMSVQPFRSCTKAFRSVSLQKQTCQARKSWKEYYLWLKTSFKMQTSAQLSNAVFIKGKAAYLLAFKQESHGEAS